MLYNEAFQLYGCNQRILFELCQTCISKRTLALKRCTQM